MRKLAALLALSLLLQGGPAWAYRPFDGTHAEVEGTGELELQLSPFTYSSNSGNNVLAAPVFEVELGVAKDWQLGLEGRHERQLGNTGTTPASSLADTELTVKTLWRHGSLQGLEGVSVATEFSILLPTINDEPGMGAGFKAIVSQSWPALTLHVNAGLDYNRAGNFEPSGSLILEGPMGWLVRPVAECSVEHELVAGSTTSLSGLFGAILQVRHGLALDLAVHQTWAAQDSRELRFGLTWEILDTEN